MVEVKNLTKRYGVNMALNNVSFKVEEGTIVGFLGCLLYTSPSPRD